MLAQRTARDRHGAAAARERTGAAGAAEATDEVIIPIDSTIILTKTDRHDDAPTYKRTLGITRWRRCVPRPKKSSPASCGRVNASANTASTTPRCSLMRSTSCRRCGGTATTPVTTPSLIERRILVQADGAGAGRPRVPRQVTWRRRAPDAYSIGAALGAGALCSLCGKRLLPDVTAHFIRDVGVRAAGPVPSFKTVCWARRSLTA